MCVLSSESDAASIHPPDSVAFASAELPRRVFGNEGLDVDRAAFLTGLLLLISDAHGTRISDVHSEGTKAIAGPAPRRFLVGSDIKHQLGNLCL